MRDVELMIETDTVVAEGGMRGSGAGMGVSLDDILCGPEQVSELEAIQIERNI